MQNNKKIWCKSFKTKTGSCWKNLPTPYHHSVGEIVYNARDLVLIIGNKIIECPSQEKYRLFETYGYYDIFQNYLKMEHNGFLLQNPKLINKI